MPADVVRELQAPSVSVSTVSTATYDTDNVESVTEEVQVGNPVDSENVLGVDGLAQEKLEGDVSALISEQKEDLTLELCWNQAAAGKQRRRKSLKVGGAKPPVGGQGGEAPLNLTKFLCLKH